MDFRKIRVVLVAAFLLLAVMPLIGIGYRLEQEGKRVITQQVGAHLMGLCEVSSAHIDDFVAERVNDLEMFVLTLLRPEIPDEAVLRRSFGAMKDTYRVYSDFFILDPGPVLVTGGCDLPEGLVRAAGAALQSGARSYVSDVFLERCGNESLPAILVAVPLQAAGGPQFLAALIDFRSIDSFVYDSRIESSGEAYLVNDQGYFVTSSRLGGRILADRIDLGERPGGISQVMDYRGKLVLRAARRIGVLPWTVIVEQDRSEYLGRLAALRQRIVVVGAVIVVVLFVAAYAAARWIVQALEKGYQREKQLEFELLQKGKLAALGLLTSGLAHELNTPLANALLYTGMLQDDLRGGKGGDQLQKLAVIEEEIKQGSHVVRNLLELSRLSPDISQTGRVQAVLHKVLAIAAPRCSARHIVVRERIARELPAVSVAESIVQEVLTNVIANAIEAMPAGGTLSLAARFVPALAKVKVEVADTGCGIAPQEIEHLFEPFYTTRDKGAGLGLFVSYNMMKRLGGDIKVISTLDDDPRKTGTLFTLEFPVSASGGQDDNSPV